jgi:hypothetical protein
MSETTVTMDVEDFRDLKMRLTGVINSLPMGSATRHELERIVTLLSRASQTDKTSGPRTVPFIDRDS